ncbi:MAG TPA: DMT family transporter [Lachnospiraceae bacterium]|nr:DMT family transporter [Lachnospiraceae bacterium]
MKLTTEKKREVLAGFGLLLIAFIWGFAFVVVKNSLDYIPAVYMLAFRFTIAGVALAVVFFKKLKKLNRYLLLHGGILGLLLFTAYLFQTIGCKYTTAGKNAFLTTIYVILVPFFHWIISKKRPDAYCMSAAVLAVIGIGLLSLQGDLTVNIGDILTIVCGIFYALHVIFIDRYTKADDPVILAVLQVVFAALFSWLTAPFIDGGFPQEAFRIDIVIGMLYLGVFSTMIGFLLQTVCQKYTHPSTSALLMSTEAVFGALCAAIFLREVMSGRMITGCLLMFAAIVLAETKPGRKEALRKRRLADPELDNKKIVKE